MKSHLELAAATQEDAAKPRKSLLGEAVDGMRAAQDERKRDGAWRHSRVATAAYYLAEHRGFQPGSEAADWRLAELQIDSADAT